MFLDGDNGYLEIIIYAIAMIGGLIANAYRNYTKRKAKENQPAAFDEDESHYPQDVFEPEEEQAKRTFPDFIFEEPEPEIVEEIAEPEEKTLTVQEAKAQNMEGQSVFQQMAEKLMEENEKPLDERNTMDEEMQAAFSMDARKETEGDEGFDLEQAIIYSEILKTKYFNNSY